LNIEAYCIYLPLIEDNNPGISLSYDSSPYTPEDCLDDDGDGVLAGDDNCPQTHNPDQANSDNDSLGNLCDNCPQTHNPDQANSDNDSLGNLCDNCPDVSNEDQADSDGDGIGDVCEPTEAAIPTLSEWGMIIFMTIIMGLGVVTLVRRRMV
jgi:hypothetical protein